MSSGKLSGVVITHEFDDGSSYDYGVDFHSNDSGKYVTVDYDNGHRITIYPESWKEIREQIQGYFDVNN